MAAYLLRRLLLMIPTVFGIMLISFIVVQFAPGGPVERVVAQMQGQDSGATSRFWRRRWRCGWWWRQSEHAGRYRC